MSSISVRVETGIACLERHLSDTENVLSKISFIPIIGTFSGAIKVALGVTQATAAIACAVFGVLALPKTTAIFKRSCVHIENGIANIVAGIIEAIPIVGTLAYIEREKSAAAMVSYQHGIFTNAGAEAAVAQAMIGMQVGLAVGSPDPTRHMPDVIRAGARHLADFKHSQYVKYFSYPSLKGKAFSNDP